MEIQSVSHHYIKKEIVMLPGDFKRDYKFKSDKKKDRLSYIIAIIVSIIAFILIWYLA